MTRFNLPPSDIAAQAAAPIEHAAAHAAMGIEQGALAALHAAAEPISPIIQMIMRMPGHIGFMSSLFEALGNFFFSHINILSHLDPSLLSLHAHVSSLMSNVHLPGLSAEHMAFDPSLLPHGAPILQAHGDLLMKGQFGHQGILKDAVNLRDQLKVSGQIDLGRPQFETGHGLSTQAGGQGGALSGPMMRDIPTANHLASSQRLFSDQLSSKSAMNSSVASTPTTQTVPNSMNVGGTTFGQPQGEAAPAVGQMADTTPAVAGSQNVSGGLDLSRSATESSTAASAPSTDLGKQLIADKGASMNFRPTTGTDAVGGSVGGYDASYLQNQASTLAHSSSAQTHALGGLKAQQLSLNDAVKPAPHLASAHPAAAHPVTGHLKPDAGSASTHHAYHYSTDQIHHRAVGVTSAAKVLISHRTNPHVQYDNVQSANSAAGAQQPVEAQTASTAGQTPAEQQAVQAQPKAGADNQAAATPDGQEVAQTPGTTAGAQGTPAAAPSTYTIRAGDCLWNIAKDHLHSATRWSEIYKMNTDVIGTNPSLIHPGTQINLPGSGSDLASSGTGLEHGEYIVKSGDNLWNISKHFLGDGSKWNDIYKANADVIGSNPDLIMPGQHLHVPGAETSAVAEAPGAAATQQVAQGVADPSAAGAGAGHAASSAPTSLEAAANPQAATQSYAPADLSQGASTQLSQAATAVPQAVAPTAVAPVAVAPAGATAAMDPTAMAPQAVAPQAVPTTAVTTPHLGGPGAAAAGELHTPPVTAAELAQTVPQKSVVSSSLAPDLSQFLRRSK